MNYRMNRQVNRFLIQGLVALTFLTGIRAQEYTVHENRYTMDRILNASSVKDQGRSGTCWSFAAISFLESELLRTGKGLYDLSEMFIVRAAYLAKADKYVRMHGTLNFGEGGEANDVTDAIAQAGIVPESVFPGEDFDTEKFDFTGMDRALKDYVDRVVRASGDSINPEWKQGFEMILDQYLGEVPETFVWQGRSYSPLSFAESLGLHMNDYILIGSYLHHPFYSGFILEIPDNWSWEAVYNVPLDEMIEVLDRSLDLGFTVVCAVDISEEGFSFEEGLAVNLEEEGILSSGKRQPVSHGASQPDERMDAAEPAGYAILHPVTQELRQEAFDHYKTQDDHAMQIIGRAHDRAGKTYYYIKNSWGSDNALDGYLLVSEEYLRYKAISFMVNRNALDPELMKKLKIQ